MKVERKKESIKLKTLAFLLAGLVLPMAFASCSNSDDEEDNGTENSEEYNNARALTVGIDESKLTYEDHTIVISGGTTYNFKKVPFGTVTVTLEDLPTSVAELKKLKLPKGMKDIHESPYLTPALMVAAINQLNFNKDEAKKMIDYIAKEVKSENRDGKMVHFPGRDATAVYVSDWNQMKQYTDFNKVRSFFDGTSYYNNYTPTSKPWKMTIELTEYSYTADFDYVQLWLTSTSLSSKREYGIWKYDSDGDGKFDYFFGSTYMQLAHSLATYNTDY